MNFQPGKSKTFECNIQLKGANLTDAKARLILECANGLNFLFLGKISSDGKCSVEIPPFKKLTETTNGNASLEIIAEETIFIPWKDTFTVEEEKKIQIEVIEQKPNITISEIKEKEHKVEVKQTKPVSKLKTGSVDSLVKYLKENNITKKILIERKDKFQPVLLEHFKEFGPKEKKLKIIELLNKMGNSK